MSQDQDAIGSEDDRRDHPFGRRAGEKMVHRLVELGIALSAEKNHDRLMEMILLEAKSIYNADGGTLYLVTEDETGLSFQIMRNDTLNIAMGGTTGKKIPFPPVPLYRPDGSKNMNNVASAVYHQATASNIADAYEAEEFDFSGTKKFDETTGYRSCSFLTVPMINTAREVIGVLQLINARDMGGTTIPFETSMQAMIEALTSQAAVALENQMLIQQQRALWNSLIEMIAASIDDKSPYTGGHCQRVPEITKLLAEAACEAEYGIFKGFDLNEDQWYELHVAAWLHDCGKVTTPEYVVDKASKLETIYNRIHEVRTRFEVLRRDAEIDCLKRKLAGEDPDTCDRDFQFACDKLQEEYHFVATANVGGEFMDDEDIVRLKEIGAQTWTRHFDKAMGLSPVEALRVKQNPPPPPPATEPLLGDLPEHLVDQYNQGELYNLSIRRGTLTAEEREKINDHIVVTIKMLEQLPFPKKMKRVPEYAGGHHEKMDGTGYPRGLKKSDMSIPARIMAIADIFEALTAADRPYKKAKTISESLKIMKFMCQDQHIDADLFDLFLKSGVWQRYADEFLDPSQIDPVSIDDYLPNPELLASKEAAE
ncbi:HD domain-containing protein [Rhodospirillaceae bacterium KN72]|uniref:HD domain-containing protein n=1 Tax=Pacificispira spongiicola TaxID=2729598 RepID=A0A7Y0E0U8_9PROT|nr:HD domain-containing phosphohydrolase [Pacificispira spongiicola]NMM45150.1 HD domain-containing protein [Pacificispira spongiicola]